MRLHWSSRGISLTCNPVIGAATPKGKPALETFAYKLEEVLRIIGLLPEPAATVAATAAFIGLRRSEIRGLLWENYDGKEIRGHPVGLGKTRGRSQNHEEQSRFPS